jgi:chromosome segregation ATPase
LAKERESELTTAQQQLTESATIVAQNQTNLQIAMESMTAATNAVNVAASEQTNRMDVAGLLTAALGSAEDAKQKVGDDAVLSDVVTKLKQRVDAAQAAVDEAQSQMNAAAVLMTTATETLAKVQTSVSEATAECSRCEQCVTEIRNAVSVGER